MLFKSVNILNAVSGFVWLFLIFSIVSCANRENREEKLAPDNNESSFFEKIPSSHSGITFRNIVEEKFETFFEWFPYVYNGGGVAIGDINNDGLQDIYFTANDGPNKLYLNQGALKFKDITVTAGVSGEKGWHNGVTMVDINADGFLDLYVCRGGWQDTDEDRTNLLYINQGDLTFKEEASKYGLDENGYSTHAVFFDLDNDLDLDAYIMNRPDSFNLGLTQIAGRAKSPPQKNRDKLYVNQDGRFTEKGIASGITGNYGYGLSVVASDLNKDGFTDLFVANDFAAKDYLYINQGDGTFKEQIEQSTNHISLFSMGADIADINNDGLEDLVVMEMKPENYVRSKISMPSMDVENFFAMVDQGQHKQYMHNMLHLNQGNLFFSEIAQYAGISKSEWSWACLSTDLDNDGYRDLFVTNGMRRDLHDGDVQLRLMDFVNRTRGQFKDGKEMMTKGFPQIVGSYKPIKVVNYIFRNNGDLTYNNVSSDWGLKTTSFSNGAAVGDLDNDGDLDLAINNLEDEAFIYENKSTKNNYLRIKLKGPKMNIDGLGAKVAVYYGDKMQFFENKTVRGYLSSSESIVHFGLGNIDKTDSLVVTWNDGKQNTLINNPINKVVEIRYSDAKEQGQTNEQFAGQFREATSKLLSRNFRHKENDFDEYRAQVLLPHMLSKSGPFISVGDVNGDGYEDFFIGGAAGQSGQLYLQKNGSMHPMENRIFSEDAQFEDMGSSFADLDGDGDLDLVVVSGGSEFPQGSSFYRDRIYYNDGSGSFTNRVFLPSQSSGSCVAINDIDDDGDSDLFIGGQVVANQYLYHPKNYIYINEHNQFIDRTNELSDEIAQVGMVNSATWVDLEGDRTKELVITGEWMPIIIYSYYQGRLRNISDKMGLTDTEGWWNKVIADDLDNDGDTDLVLGNIGENYKFKASREMPFEVYAGDFDLNGTNDIFLAQHYKNQILPIRGKECTSQQMPVINRKFPTFNSFAKADLFEIIGPEIGNGIHKSAKLFSSVILENINGRFTIRRLPNEAQFSAIHGIIIEDFNADGIKDILIAGNNFDVEVETTPADASPGYLLEGKGNFEYEAIGPMKSGFFVPYNVKDIATINIQGTNSILVGINDQPIKVFRKIRD